MNERVPSQRLVWLTAPLLFVSGFCALIYQVVWTRELRLVFGATTAASSAVVAIFIAGLGFGGLWLGRRVERSGDALRFYAALELAIALFSAATPLLLSLVGSAYVATGGSLQLGASLSTLVRLLLSALVLGPPTFLMGGTLPAIARAIETARDQTRRSVAVVYGVNTLGAVVGCALSTFVLLEWLGTRDTLFFAAALNLVVAGFAWLLSRRAALSERLATRHADGDATEDAPPVAPSWLVFVSAALVGFAFFLMELVWYRMLQPPLGGTVFAFGLILALALLGIGIGSTLYAVLLSGRRTMLLGFAITCVAEALCMAIPFAIGDQLAIWATLLRPLGFLGFHGLVLGWTVIAGVMVLPAAIVSGFQFPLLIALLGGGRAHVGRDVGTAYAANTLGAVLGALAGGFGLLPALGAVGCFRLVASLLAVWGLSVGLYAWKLRALPRARSFGWVAGLFAATLLLSFTRGPTAVLRHAPVGVGRVAPEEFASANLTENWLRTQRRSIAVQMDGIESAIGIHRGDGVAFVVNGKIDGNARYDAATQVMGGLVGAALRPRVKRAMVIGLGTGSTAGWLARLPEIQRVDVAELEPAVLEVARQCRAVNEDVLNNPKVQIHQGDARELLTVSPARYDLIFSEPSNPYRAGVASLYTREFYQSVKRHLPVNGVFVQWLQAYDVDARTLRTIYKTLGSVFPFVETFQGSVHDLLLVATRKRPVHDVAALEARLKQPPFARAMKLTWYAEGVEGFLSHYLANPAYARAAARVDADLNTDDRTVIEFGFARGLRKNAGETARSLYTSMRATRDNRPSTRGGSVDWERVDYEREAFAVFTASLYQTDHLSPAYRDRLSVLLEWYQGNFSGAGTLWNELGQRAGEVAPLPIERLALAEVYATVGSTELKRWIEPLTKDQPTLGPALSGLWELTRGDRRKGTELLVDALQRYRSDPWPKPEIMTRVLNGMRLRGSEERDMGLRWLDVLDRPFASYINESHRHQARANIGHALGAREPVCLEVMKQLEPHVPYTKVLLEYRAECYRVHGHALRDEAERDLAAFYGDEPDSFDKVGK